MRNELVFSIKNIFNSTSPEGVLQQYGAKKYYIAPYQRGYKWAAVSPNDAVCVLMDDLLEAAKTNNEYYLQFITTKLSRVKEIPVLEVIDGQQRLTTLTILLSVLSFIKGNNENAISNDLLSYEVRQKVTDFFKNHIYQKIDTLMSDDSWDEFILKFPENDEQDIYYLYNAANKINKILIDKFHNNRDVIISFENYILDNVKIILNNIDRDVDCEEIFSNLNDNKVELTSSELIKGLILTNSARELPNDERKITYKEIIELRAIMGRQWDEIAHWANREEVKTFFFPDSDNVLDKLLGLLALDNGFAETNDTQNKNIEFNYFQSQIKKGAKTAKSLFDNLKEIKSVLNEWFNDNNIYNSLGYVFFCRPSKKTIGNYLSFIRRDKSELKKELNATISNILNFDIKNLQYNENNMEIYNLLLALSVFGDENRFNFTAFNNTQSNWSLEHIFPQKPEKLKDELGQKDIELLKSLSENNLCNFEKVKNLLQEYEASMNIEDVYNSLSEKLNKSNCTLSSDEKTILYRLIKKDKLHSIGNMALLTGPDNSSNGNGMFDNKRYNIVRRVSAGSFVPKHTYDVFSKLISEKMTPNLTVWTTVDIDEHFEWICNKINKIRSTK
jgi:uncharacterized protein with ParB-like and HNH nuclease domain